MNYYKTLNIEITASTDEIKKAYKKLAMQYHPDRTNGNKELEEKFKNINVAYQTLSNINLKNIYDKKNNFYPIKEISLNHSLTNPYDSSLNVFMPEIKEIFEIIKSGTTRQLKQILGLQPKLHLESHYYQKYTPLMESSFLEQKEMVEFICKYIKEKYTKNDIIGWQYKRYLNQINIEGKTALIIATLSNEKLDIIKYLVHEGADIYIKDREGKDIFFYAPYSSSEEVEDFIISLKK